MVDKDSAALPSCSLLFPRKLPGVKTASDVTNMTTMTIIIMAGSEHPPDDACLRGGAMQMGGGCRGDDEVFLPVSARKLENLCRPKFGFGKVKSFLLSSAGRELELSD